MTAAVAAPVTQAGPDTVRYARCIDASKRVRWDIDRDVIRGRRLDFGTAFMPIGMTRCDELPFLDTHDARFLSHVQARTYANMFAWVEHLIAARTLERFRAYARHDPVAGEALVRLVDEASKHEALFRRLESMAAADMPPGYAFLPSPDALHGIAAAESDWAVLALILEVELSAQAHYRASIEPDPGLSALWKDVLLFHWKEASQHAVIGELQWRRLDARGDDAQRDAGVGELIELLRAIDGVCASQSRSDADYFIANARAPLTPEREATVRDTIHKAYRWQYIASGSTAPRFIQVLRALLSPARLDRLRAAIAPIVAHTGYG